MAPFQRNEGSASELNHEANSLLPVCIEDWLELVDKSSETTLHYSDSPSARILKLKNEKRRAERGAMSQVRSQFDSLLDENKELQAENAKVLAERDSCRQMLKGMSWLVRSLQSSSSSDVEENIQEEQEDEDLLTPERAMEMTLKNNKSCIECLDDERQRLSRELIVDRQEKMRMEDFLGRHRAIELTMKIMKSHIQDLKVEKETLVSKCEAQHAAIASLEEQEELKAAKVEILEGMVRALMKDSDNI
jgi:chromosome segregation ATPase